MAEVGVSVSVSVSGSTLSSFSLTKTTTLYPSNTHTPNFLYFSRYRSHIPSLTHSNPRALTSHSNPTSLDLTQPDLDNQGGGPNANGGGGGGGSGGGGGGGDNSKGDEESDGDKRKMALLMSQKFTLAYAALVGVGGLMGYLKSGSSKSLLAGGLSASLLYYVYTELPGRPVFASSIGLGISAALLGVMGSRFKKSGKVFPAGVVSFVSLIMTGGYLHGIMRSAH